MLFTRISQSIAKYSTTKVALISLMVFMGTVIFILPAQSASSPRESPDLSIFYSVDDLTRMAESYGEEGRAQYIHARITFDIIWPIIYTVFLASSISWLITRGFSEKSIGYIPIFYLLPGCFLITLRMVLRLL